MTKLLLVVVGVVVLLNIILFGFIQYKSRNKSTVTSTKSKYAGTTATRAEDDLEKARDALTAKLKQQSDSAKKAGAKLQKNCLVIPNLDPKVGTTEPTISSSTSEFTYEAQLQKVETKTERGCDYTILLMQPKVASSKPYTLKIPSNLTYELEQYTVAPGIYKSFVGKSILLKITYEPQISPSSTYIMKSWQALRFYTQ